MNKIKRFFQILWHCISFPYYWFTTRKIDKKLTRIAEEDRMALITEKDVEFLKSIGVGGFEALQNDGKSAGDNNRQN